MHRRPGYDGPTGLGTPHGVTAFTLRHGTITGTVTNAATGAPVNGAQVTIGGGTATSNARGAYTLAVPARSYTVTASDYTYTSATDNGVTITNRTTTTEDFSLTPQPTVTISGQVTDGSGHGWPLYATVTASGVPGEVHTNPYTGDYTIAVLPSATYTLQVTPVAAGYQATSQQVAVGTSDITQDVAVQVNSAAITSCTAPGYASHWANAYSQTFDGTSVPPDWTVQDITGSGRTWVFDDPGQRGNLTGGSGGFAVADPAAEGGSVFSELISPSLDLSNDPNPVLTFDTYDTNANISSVLVSTDGGNTWTALTQNVGNRLVGGSEPTNLSGPGTVSFSLPQAANSPDVKIEFNDLNISSGVWEIDNFSVGNLTCVLQAGGLVAGVIKDANTHAGLVGATVTSAAHPGESATTVATPGDPGLPDGFYEMFAAGHGGQSFKIADANNYQSQAKTVQVAKDGVTKASSGLQAGDLQVSQARLPGTVVSGKAVTEPVTITNTGAVTASFTLAAQQPDGSDAAWLSATPATGQIPAGGSLTVQVTLTSAGAAGTSQPGIYSGAIVASTDTPYTFALPVTMTVTPVKTWGEITGTVDRSHLRRRDHPLAGRRRGGHLLEQRLLPADQRPRPVLLVAGSAQQPGHHDRLTERLAAPGAKGQDQGRPDQHGQLHLGTRHSLQHPPQDVASRGMRPGDPPGAHAAIGSWAAAEAAAYARAQSPGNYFRLLAPGGSSHQDTGGTPHTGVVGLLEAAGLSPAEESVYLAILDLPPVTVGEAQDACGGMSHAEVSAVLDVLAGKGLLTQPSHDPRRYVVVAPQVGVGVLLARREAELQQARAVLAGLAERYRAVPRHGDGGELVQVIARRPRCGAGATRWPGPPARCGCCAARSPGPGLPARASSSRGRYAVRCRCVWYMTGPGCAARTRSHAAGPRSPRAPSFGRPAARPRSCCSSTTTSR